MDSDGFSWGRYISEDEFKALSSMMAASVIKPINLSNVIPDGFIEDFKKFSVASVDAGPVSQQLTELESSRYYIIKEIRFFFGGTAEDDAYFHVCDGSVNTTSTRFIEGYYNEGSFAILTGNRNSRVDRALTEKPYVFLSAGTGSVAQTVYGSVHYYYYR